jgi:hypothetical protein
LAVAQGSECRRESRLDERPEQRPQRDGDWRRRRTCRCRNWRPGSPAGFGELDLADVTVTVNDRGAATVVAAASLSGIRKRVTGQAGRPVGALVPTVSRAGDEVLLVAADLSVEGAVVAARSGAAEPPATA